MVNVDTFKTIFKSGFKLIECYGINKQGHCTCYKGAECTSAGKHPIKKDWKNNYIRTEAELDAILKNRPNANLGIVTGGSLVVVDIDPKNGGLESFEQIKDLFTSTLTVKTGGNGYHYYYHTNQQIGNRTGVLPGIDVRGEGGFVVAPGSKHKSGNYYTIIKENKNEF